jgi:hypothetical protein
MARISLVVVILVFLIAPASQAQTDDAGPILRSAALALGMVRGPQRRMDSINTIQFSGVGYGRVPTTGNDWTRFEISEMTVGMSYFIPAMRWDMLVVNPNGADERLIHVVAGDRAWNESLPGIGAVPAPGEVTSRLRQIWLTPHGLIRAAVDAYSEDPSSVRTAIQAGKHTVSVTINGSTVTATLDIDNRLERVEMMIEHAVLGETTLTSNYDDYVDWPILDVYFPSHITHRLNNEISLDLTVTSFYQNPYVVFPVPSP